MKTFCTFIFVLGCLLTPGLGQETIAETDTPTPEQAIPTPDSVPVATPAPSPTSAEALAKQPVIPEPYAATRYEKTWDKNPFLLKTVKPEGPKTSWAQDWALAGMFNNQGKIRVSLVNKQTGEYKHISNQDAGDPEFRLIEATFNRDRSEASAKIAKSGDEQTITYDDTLTSRPVTINNTQQAAAAAAGGSPGNPNAAVRPGSPVKPGGAPVNRNPGQPLPGAVNPGVLPGAVNPNVNTTSGPVPPSTPPVSRRRQLIPGTVPQPPQ